MEPNALQLMYKILNNNRNFDLVIAGYNKYDETNTKIFGMSQQEIETLTIESAIIEMFSPRNGEYQGYLWNKMFRSDIISKAGLRFNESISFNEDRLFIIQYLCKIKRNVAYTTTPVYNYVVRTSGAMGSLQRRYNPRYATDFDAYVLMKQCVFNFTKSKQLRKLSAEGICMSYIDNLTLMVKHDGYDSLIRSKLLKGLIQNNVLSSYITFIFKSAIIRLLLLVYPQLLVKIKRRHPRDAT